VNSKLIQHSDRTSVSTRGFASGRAAERLFGRHARARGFVMSLALHACTVGSELLCRLASLSAVTSLAGRVAALAKIGALEEHEHRLAAAFQQLEQSLAERKAARNLRAQKAALPSVTHGSKARRRAA